jgi:heptose-I-phosphate ethanolaminephosphotransferase
MQKFTWQYWKELGLIACCYLLALLPPFIVEWLNDYSGVYWLYDNRDAYGLNTSLIILLFAVGLACLTQYLGRYQRAGFALIITVLVTLGIVATAHVVLYGAPISVGAIDALLGTDIHEALEYLSFQWSARLAFTAVGYAALLAVSIGWVRRQLNIEQQHFAVHGIAWPLVIVLVLAAYQHPAVAVQNKTFVAQWQFWARVHNLNNQVPSLRIIRNIGEWFSYREWLQVSQAQRATYSFHASLGSAAPRTLVIVLGESLRRSNLSLYGYDKPTTPNLDARRAQMLVFNRAVAPANQTVPSVTMMLTQATVLDPDKFLLQPSILSAAKEAGYHTYWLSNQGRVGQFDSKISLVAHDAHTTVYTNTEFYGGITDDKLLHPLAVALQDPYPHKLIVMHMQGSHQSYENRYPATAAVFTADQYGRRKLTAKQNAVLAQYDNSVRYTDQVLENILAQLDKQPGSLLVFVSDHGERFYENGVDTAGHGYSKPTKSEFDVPYFIWCNAACPPQWQQAAEQHRDLAFSTQNLFHTSAQLLGLQFDDYRDADDILSSQYKPTLPQVIATERKVLNYATLP